jgi:glycerate 2-kinase
MDPRALLLQSFHAAVAAADPLTTLPPHLPAPPAGRTLVVGAGKASGAMAAALEQHWPNDAPLDGLVVTRYGHALPTRRIEVVEAAHPVPDAAGQRAAEEILRRVQLLGPSDLLVVLVSGGGSALLTLPVEGIGLEDLQETTRALLTSGASIQDMNTVRKHLSRLQGGRLAAACRAPLRAFIISDVTGDEATHIASGPCAPDPSTFADALEIMERYEIQAPPSVRAYLEQGAQGRIAETPKPGDPLFQRVENRIIATARRSLSAASDFFHTREVPAIIVGDSVTGEAAEVAKVYGALVRQMAQYGEPRQPPVAIISGGECTVTVRGTGRGGRCSEFLLSLGIDLDERHNAYALACDTDGIDGSEDNAGAILTPDSLRRAYAQGLRPKKLLANHDSYGFFSALGDLVVTGPTRTNVNDYRAILLL